MKAPRTNPKRATGNPRLTERIHDPYKAPHKLHDPTRCPACGAVFKKGRWQWAEQPPHDAEEGLCPACRRVEDHYPAGEVLLEGEFVAAHADELTALVRHVSEAERNEHPLHRVMAVERHGGSILVTTTDIHLPRRIGHAVEDAYQGQLSTHYDEDGYFARVRWERQT